MANVVRIYDASKLCLNYMPLAYAVKGLEQSIRDAPLTSSS